MCIRDRTSTIIKDLKILIPEQNEMLVIIGSEVKKQRKDTRNKAVSYTHLDVYKRQEKYNEQM